MEQTHVCYPPFGGYVLYSEGNQTNRDGENHWANKILSKYLLRNRNFDDQIAIQLPHVNRDPRITFPLPLPSEIATQKISPIA